MRHATWHGDIQLQPTISWRLLAFSVLLVACCLLQTLLFASQLPSLFRGVVVADSSLGVRVVSVEEDSQAFFADLRPEDLIVRIGDRDVHSIDEFATLSHVLKGQVANTTLLIFRNNSPRELSLHLYSYPILQEWSIEFVPDDTLRFAQPQVGRDYWARLGRGFEEAHRPTEALNAYLNGLHNVPTDVELATKVAALFSRIGQERIRVGELASGLASLRQALVMLQRLFDYSLSEVQLQIIRDQLRETLETLRHVGPH